jgi:hypothetical protein
LKSNDSILLIYLGILDPDDCCLWNCFFSRNTASLRVRGHFSSDNKKILYDARDFVAGFAPKVLEDGSEVSLIVFLERASMVRGLRNVRGLLLDISFTSGEGSSTNSRYIHIRFPQDGLSDGFT